jgi:hypothetical protein
MLVTWANPELAGLSVRHNLDLYNDTQIEKFVRRPISKMLLTVLIVWILRIMKPETTILELLR